MNKNSKIKVLVALSGGVDSAVAAALLVKQGYNVTGAYFVNYDDSKVGVKNNQASCWLPDYRDAVRVAAKLQIPIKKLNFVKEYKKMVLDYMFKEYKAGRTPNPDVLCNKYIKFGVWMDWATKHGFDYLATGHYANVKFIANSSKRIVKLLAAKDDNKDQTYFLHQLNQKQLARTMFPVGNLLKFEVRSLATKFGLPVAQKAESMGICFIGEVPMKKFLQTQIKPKPGNIVLLSTATIGAKGLSPLHEVIGSHDGLAFYTIGQRHFGLSSLDSRLLSLANSQSPKSKVQSPLFVVAKRSKANELVVGYETDPLLYSKQITVDNVNWICQKHDFPLKCMVRLRHRQSLQECVVKKARKQESKKTIQVEFSQPQKAVTPGQFAVFYLKGECLGGGVIV